MGTVPSCLVAGPPCVEQEDNALDCESWTKEVAGGLGSGLRGLHMKNTLLLPLGIGQPWEGSVFSIKAPEQRTYKTWLIMRWGHVGSVTFYTGLQG